jgi:hypothetical protein
MRLAVLANQRLGFLVGDILNALLRAEMEFHPSVFIALFDETVGVAAEAVHVPEALRDAALAHHDGDLVERLGQQGPEVPIVVGGAQTRAQVALDRMIKVREAQRISEEEDGRVIAHHVPIAFLV